MNRVQKLDAENFSCSVDAGCTLQQVKDACEAADCLFPLALGAQGSCQIGGNVATNAGGINVLRYGMARDLILGLEACCRTARSGSGFSGLRKDNRGYDLKQLFIGSEGTLGIITGVELKLFPKTGAGRDGLSRRRLVRRCDAAVPPGAAVLRRSDDRFRGDRRGMYAARPR